MSEYDCLWDFQNLYDAHKKARRGKQGNAEVIQFEMRLAENLVELSDALKNRTYRQGSYYTFMVHDPKDRVIHALRYRDRVVQHCICDNLLGPEIDRRLIYDNAACRTGKGTDFARNRLTGFMREHYRAYSAQGYFLKCDIRKFFDNIDHDILKRKLLRVFHEEPVIELLNHIIDSYFTRPGKGLPLGNQTSQWFAIFYLDGLDRMVKEQLGVRHYTRYMDDFILLHHDKKALQSYKTAIQSFIESELELSYNDKTQIIPLSNGCEYLGFRFYMTENGKVVRKLCNKTKIRLKHRLKKLDRQYGNWEVNYDDIKQVLTSYRSHLSKGHTYRLQCSTLNHHVFRRLGQGEEFS